MTNFFDWTRHRNVAGFHQLFQNVFQDRVRHETCHDVANAACSVDQMHQLSIDLLKRGKPNQNRVRDVMEKFSMNADRGFGVRVLCVHIQLHHFVVKSQVFDVNVDFEFAGLASFYIFKDWNKKYSTLVPGTNQLPKPTKILSSEVSF